MAHRHRKVDVVTVGAGWTAGILAQQLTEHGLEVVSLERGRERWTTPDFAHNHDALGYEVRKRMMYDLTTDSWTWRPNPRAPSLPMRRYGAFHPGQGGGGSGVHWTAMVWRFFPSDFRYRTHHIQRYGPDGLPEGSTVQDWPITYEELEPYYDRWEYDIGVSGQAGNVGGEIVPGGNPFEGPRRRGFPLPPLAVTRAADRFTAACEQLGYHPFPQPAGILSRGYRDLSGRPRSACLYCGFCTRYGCEVDAKASALTAHIPMALATGRYEIRYGADVRRIVTREDGTATGLLYLDANGEEHEQPADIVIISGYTLSNVRLLLLSSSDAHPQGVGNARAQVGRNFTYQLWKTPVRGVFEGERFNLFAGNGSTINVIHDFNGDNFDHSDLGFIGGASIFAGLGERDPLVTVEDVTPALAGAQGGIARTWGRGWKEALRRAWDSVIGITIQGESLPYADQFFDLDPNFRDVRGDPLLRLTFDWHRNDRRLYRYIAARCEEIMREMGPSAMESTPELEPFEIQTYQSTHITGGAIMGVDPATSVTNRYGQVWDAPNVFVTGAALYPQNPGHNPTETLCALAYMTAEAMKDRYLGEPGRLIT